MCTFIVTNLLHNELLLQADIPVFTTPEPRCNDFDLTLENISFFLQDSYVVYAGNVETCINGTYFSICDIGWDDVEAQLICNALGLVEPYFRKLCCKVTHKTIRCLLIVIQFHRHFSGGVAVRGLIPTSQPALENVMCPSNATSASNCSFVSPPISSRCYGNFSAAGVQCIQGR